MFGRDFASFEVVFRFLWFVVGCRRPGFGHFWMSQVTHTEMAKLRNVAKRKLSGDVSTIVVSNGAVLMIQ